MDILSSPLNGFVVDPAGEGFPIAVVYFTTEDGGKMVADMTTPISNQLEKEIFDERHDSA